MTDNTGRTAEGRVPNDEATADRHAKMDDATLLKLVNASGFPFQLRVEDEIRQSRGHRWTVAGREVPWRSQPTKQTGFADLVLEQGMMRLVIECKRLGDKAAYVFLAPDTQGNPRDPKERFRAYCTRAGGGGAMADWKDVEVQPASVEVDFAVVQGQTDKDRPLLERIGAELVVATEAIGDSEAIRSQQEERWVYCPMLVTTADLYLCRFATKDTSLDRGKLDSSRFESVGAVRFRKALSTHSTGYTRANGLGAFVASHERSVLVVNAMHLMHLLTQWDMPNLHLNIREYL